ncbi:MAG TPA: exonuclease SbcCD subunit D [Candidatus Blautia intestinipullorum]|nr:exonuclease SbcCD subunit D [Candidatus Blautia intestinipullorum]
MKFFHLSDLHIGLKLMNRDLREDQEYIFRQITDLASREQPDAVVIAGDIYDKAVPSAEAVEVFDSFAAALADAVPKAAIMMISGNHDSAPRVNCFRNILSRQKFYMVGQPPQREDEYIEKVTLEDEHGKVNFYLLPFVKPSMVKMAVGTDENGNNLSYNETVRRIIEREKIDQNQRNVLVSHQFYLPSGKKAEEVERMDSEIRTVGNIDEVSADILEIFDYGALGHIHKPMKVGRDRFRYCGTPLACSVSEAGQEKGILMVELGEKGEEPGISVLPLKPLRQVKVIRGSLPEVLGQACEDYVSAVLTDKADLDVIDMQDRLRHAFPNLLEIRRENLRKADYTGEMKAEEDMLDPYELCCSFLQELDEEEKEILRDVIHTVQEVK